MAGLPARSAPQPSPTSNSPATALCSTAAAAGFPGEVATVTLEPMTGPSGEEVVNTVSIFTDIPIAQAAVRQADGLVLQCTDQIGEALKRAIRLAAKDIGVDDLILDIDGSLETWLVQEIRRRNARLSPQGRHYDTVRGLRCQRQDTNHPRRPAHRRPHLRHPRRPRRAGRTGSGRPSGDQAAASRIITLRLTLLNLRIVSSDSSICVHCA